MKANIFENRKKNIDGKTQVPVWFMRQAGRYHQHYQNIKKHSDFMSMCRDPKLANAVTLGPIEDFKFDAAILFSDLLFPLEQLGMGLNYHQGPPQLGWHLHEKADLKKLKIEVKASEFYRFQHDACALLKTSLPDDVTLLGFVGAPFTLYTYAAEGAHAGSLVSARKGLYDGRYEGFIELLLPQLLQEMTMQAAGGAEAICLFDTAAGELSPFDYKRFVVPVLEQITAQFKQLHPKTRIVYYSKHTHLQHLESLATVVGENIDVLGVDWRHDLAEVFKHFSGQYFIQGNFDPSWLHLEWKDLEQNLIRFKAAVDQGKIDYSRWIFGLGHGVLQHTPEVNVKKTVEWVHQNLVY